MIARTGWFCFLLFLGFAFDSRVAFASFRLSPQKVVDLTLKKNLDATQVELNAKKAFVALDETNGRFDVNFKASANSETDRAQNINGTSNLENRTARFGAALEKKFSTGTKATLSLEHLEQQSVLSPYSQSLRTANQNQDFSKFGLRQNLWQNSFGYADRLSIERDEKYVEGAKLNRDEELEEVLLKNLRLYWSAYTASEEFRLSLAAREKYIKLADWIRQRKRYNLATPGEQPRLEAQLAMAREKVKLSSARYLRLLNDLLTSMQEPLDQVVEFEVAEEIPLLPKLPDTEIEKLRSIEIAKINVGAAELNRRAVKSENFPKFDLVGSVSSTGVEPSHDRALSEMVGGKYPTYFIGVEFEMPLDSNTTRAKRTRSEIEQSLEEAKLAKQRNEVRNKIVSAQRESISRYEALQEVVSALKFKEAVVKESEPAYQRGSLTLIELIRSYDDLFDAQVEKAQAVGRYHTALNEWAAIRDELVLRPGEKR